ncbi:porin [Methylobacterium sp. C25]|uniref:outer membrane beta-barrel protein n=1 Tax=Methylobacterium sp. C25 TaxID=2721622 RepID=UPI001F40CA9E|nr:outer membrane beta-barrel protein [Methylobacterium sp. C25]MCE4223289.1 porin [Methylobacterium sp. C25]
MSSKLMLRASAATIALLAAGNAFAADLPAKAAPPVIVEEHCKAALSTPSYGPTIKAPTDNNCWASPIGDLYLGGALSGYAYSFQSAQFAYAAPTPGTDPERTSRLDFSNAMLWIQKADGPFQFFVAAGLYSIPGLGLPVYQSWDQNSLLFGPVPAAYGKYQINEEWSVQGGRMFTNIGSELPFTFQNINISRGLLFGQENIINQGAQVNYSSGPLSASVAVTDGFYSGELNWVTGAITYKLDDSNTIGVNGGTHFNNFNSATRGFGFQFATPLALQNSSIVSANYTYANGPWTVTPYIQYTAVDSNAGLGLIGAETFGASILAAYNFTDNFSLGGRFEYITQSGNRNDPFGRTNVLYGPGSEAFSYTITPTFTYGRYFLRGEYAHVDLASFQRGTAFAGGGVLGLGFGRFGNKSGQDRYLIETGFTF